MDIGSSRESEYRTALEYTEEIQGAKFSICKTSRDLVKNSDFTIQS